MPRNPYDYEPLNKPLAWNTTPAWALQYNEPDFTRDQNNRSIARINETRLQDLIESQAQEEQVAEELSGQDFSLDNAYDVIQRVAIESGDINRALEVESAREKAANQKEIERNRKLSQIAALAAIDPELGQSMWQMEGLSEEFGKTPSFRKPEPVRKEKPDVLWNERGEQAIVDANDPDALNAAYESGFVYSTKPKQDEGSSFGSRFSTERDSKLGTPKGESISSIINRFSGNGQSAQEAAERARLMELRAKASR